MLNYSFDSKNESKSNNMENMDNSSNSETVVVINCILNVPLMFTSIAGNALVLFAILRTPSLRSLPSNIFLCSLAITDFLVGLIVQPVYIANRLHHSSGRTLAIVEDLMSFFLCGVSLKTITAISVDRFLALHYHVTYANLMTTKRIEIHAQQQAVNSFNIIVNNIPDSNDMIISRKHALKTFIYYICMIFCYLPYLSYSLLRTTLVIGHDVNWSSVDTVVFLNSSVNPFLYCWCNREIRMSAVK
ncbi:unnamed protein product, partial [Porites evermanni]